MKHLYLLSIVLILFSCNTFQNQKKNNNPIQTIETITVLGDTLHSPEIKDGKSLDQFKSAKDPMERLEIHRKIQALPRNSAPSRIRNRCWATGKPRGVYRDFGLCRNQLRERAHYGVLPGVVKSSW